MSPFDHPAQPNFSVGDKVMVTDPESFVADLRGKLRGRTGVIEKVGGSDDLMGGFKGSFLVRFLKRGNRGKEFKQWLRGSSLGKAP